MWMQKSINLLEKLGQWQNGSKIIAALFPPPPLSRLLQLRLPHPGRHSKQTSLTLQFLLFYLDPFLLKCDISQYKIFENELLCHYSFLAHLRHPAVGLQKSLWTPAPPPASASTFGSKRGQR